MSDTAGGTHPPRCGFQVRQLCPPGRTEHPISPPSLSSSSPLLHSVLPSLSSINNSRTQHRLNHRCVRFTKTFIHTSWGLNQERWSRRHSHTRSHTHTHTHTHTHAHTH